MIKSDYKIIKCEDCLRVTYLPNPELHTHVHSKVIAQKLIEVACSNGKIPHDKNYRFYESLYRILPPNCTFKDKVFELMQSKADRKKQYYNSKVRRNNKIQ